MEVDIMMDNNIELFQMADTCPTLEQQLETIVSSNGGSLPEDFTLQIVEVFQSKVINQLLIDSGYLRKGDAIRKTLEMKCSRDNMTITVNIHVKL